MEGRTIIIEGKMKKNILALIILTAGIIIGLVSFAVAYNTFENVETYINFGYGIGDYFPYWIKYDSNFSRFYTAEFFDNTYGYMMLFGILAVIVSIVLKVFTEQCEIIVTESSVCGKIARGKKVEIPLNQITAIHRCSFNGISLSALSGIYNFYLIENQESVINELSHLLASPNADHAMPQESTEKQAIEQIQTLKKLVDEGVLTQEEFDAKKKQLLGL